MSTTLKLELTAQLEYLSLVTSFVDNAGRAFGLDEQGVMALVLASEEIMATLCQLKMTLTVEARNGIYYTEVDLSFPKAQLPLAMCNITASVSAGGSDEELEDMGWLLASRSVDQFDIAHLPGRKTRIRLRKYREYEDISEKATLPSVSAELGEIRAPDPQELLLFGLRALQQQDVEPNFTYHFSPPERLLHMARSQEFEVLVAFSDRGDPLGGVIIDRTRPALAMMHGPVTFIPSEDLAIALFHAVLNHLARTSVRGVFTESLTPKLPVTEMERLSSRRLKSADGPEVLTSTSYRHLKEDDGFTVWSTPWLRPFLTQEYERLALPREIQTWRRTSAGPEHQPSVLSCEFFRRRSEVLIRPVVAGNDIEKNLREHLDMLTEEGILNVTFVLDVGESFQLAFSEGLERCGFRPNCLIPSAGKGDVLLFFWESP